MNAGLPTTGIGGIFYFLSVILMCVVEIVKTLQGKSSRKSWIFVSGQVMLVVSIIASIWFTGEIIGRFIPASARASLVAMTSDATLIQNTTAVVLTPFLLLAFLLTSTQLLRVYFYVRRSIK